MNNNNVFYITTAIDYPNGAPHFGHAFEKIVADTYARWNRFLGHKTYFLTGTDENGQKLQIAAEASGSSDVLGFVGKNAQVFKKLCEDLKITNDDFIRTTEKRHVDVAKYFWETLEKNDDIYLGKYSGNYCYDCEQFYPDNQIEDGKCPSHGKSLTYVEEEGYFFRQSKYSDWITSYINEHQDFIFPSSARKEMLGRLKADKLEDLSISRLTKGWGITVPGHEEHVMYTWFDALMNYYAPVHSGDFEAEAWPCSSHVIGKDITWFHAVIWPIMLHAMGIALPKQIHVHGMVLDENGKKMSKSLGNVVDPYDLINQFPNDTIRYYMLRSISSGQDGKVSFAGVKERHNNELANEFGNLVNRAVKLSLKRIGSSIDASSHELEFNLAEETVTAVKSHMAHNMHHLAIDSIWEGVSRLNTYLNDKEPWRIKDDPKKFGDVMYTSLHGVYVLGTLFTPFLPEAAAKIQGYLGIEPVSVLLGSFAKRDFLLTDPQALFARMD